MAIEEIAMWRIIAFDVGIYCLNATRYLTGEEPIEISALFIQRQTIHGFEVKESVSFTANSFGHLSQLFDERRRP